MNRVDIAEVRLWGRKIGAVAWDAERRLGSYEHAENFLESGIEPAPLTMPLGRAVFYFPELNRVTFQGLPGMLSDSLPDKFGNLLIDQWLAGQGRAAGDFSPLERLCYMGERGMGALEFHPLLKGGIRAVVDQIRRCRRKPGQGTGRSARLRKDRIHLPSHGPGGGD